jgi:monofunctional glycosyltransferase
MVRRCRVRLRTVLLALLLGPWVAVVLATLAYRFVEPPITVLQAIRLVEGRGFDRSIRPLAALGPHLPRLVIASEDNRFCTHRGIDWPALRSEWERWRAGASPRGASTLTMQLTRNLFLWPDRSRVRKVLEVALTPVVDGVLPKRRIVEIYLNQVEFAPGVYGAEAAARHHFGKPAAALDRREAALLVALLPGPLVRRPGDATVQRHATRIERRVGQLGPLLDCISD